MLLILALALLTIKNCNAASSFKSRPQSTLCVKNDAFCAQDNLCSMRYYPVNSSACTILTFKDDKVAVNSLALGRVHLDSYLYEDRAYSQTAFNITFTNISWTSMAFRIMQTGNNGKNTCRQFTRLENSSTVSIAYDCLWSDESYEGKTFIFDYEAHLGDSIESSKFLFNVPWTPFYQESSGFDDTPLLTYVETLPTHLGRTVFNLYWPPLANEVNFNVKCYRVYVFYNDTKDKIMHSSDICDCDPDLCTYTTQMWFGVIRFGVQPIFENGSKGYITKTQIFDLGNDSARPLLFGIISLSIIIPVILYMLLYLRNYIIKRVVRSTPPKVLVIYSPVTTNHLHMVESFVNYLNTHCCVQAVMDELDIPNSASKDPFIWCAEAIQSADVICIITSPFFGRLRTNTALYRTDRLLLRLFREHYSSGGKTRYCLLLPPYATIADIPIEASSLRKMRLPEDLDDFLRFIRYRWSVPSFLAPKLSGGADEFIQNGSEIIECIKNTTEDLKSNADDYIRQLNDVKDIDDYPKLETKALSKEEEVFISPPSETFLLSEGMYARKKENRIHADDAFNDYSGNLERLNLLGEKEQTVVVQTTKSSHIGVIDLNQLNL